MTVDHQDMMGQTGTYQQQVLQMKIKKNTTPEEDPVVESRPSASTQGGPGISPILNLQGTNLRMAPQAPPKERYLGNYPSTDSLSSWRNFKTDNSPLSTSNSKQTSKSLISTVPFLGTASHPITTSSSSSSDGAGGFETGPSAKSTDVFSNNQDTSTDSDKTIIVTSTPLKSDSPPLRRSDMETMSGDSLQLPSEIFGSPNSCEQNFMIQPDEQPDIVIVSEDLNDGMNKCPSSYQSTSTSEDNLDQALKDMCRALTHSQNVKKRKYFAQTIAGE